MRHYTLITLFPGIIGLVAEFGVTGRAVQRGLVRLDAVNPRDFAGNRHGTVDDAPYGGGPGMVMMVPPLRRAIAHARGLDTTPACVVHLTPQGRPLEQALVLELAARPRLVLVAGRYEGIDERVVERDIDLEISIGDYVLSGGELPALVLLDAVIRTLPEVLHDADSAGQDSFAAGLLDCPHYTRPATVDDQAVPAVLLSGDHAAVERWRRKQALGRTWQRRPELLARTALSAQDLELLAEFRRDLGLPE